MNRSTYYNQIEQRLATLCTQIELRGKINILDYHVHSENFYRDLFNLLYDWRLENLNSLNQNVEAIDLVDRENKIVVQVSATNTKAKIESALSKPLLSTDAYRGYTFKFISIAKDASDLRKQSYNSPSTIQFTPVEDIYDLRSILHDIHTLSIDKMEAVYGLIKKELGSDPDLFQLESNLASVINALSKENLSVIDMTINVNSFEIDRKIDVNKLEVSKVLIHDYKLYHHIVDRIYSEFDKQGYNKSISVLRAIQKQYLQNCHKTSGDQLFNLIIANISQQVAQSLNFEKIAQEELELCVGILVVDAFIRCKIFINPNHYCHATT